LRKYSIKFKSLFIVFVAVIVVATIALNINFNSRKNEVIQTTNRNFRQEISLGRIIYLPPNFLILKSTVIKEAAQQQNKLLIVIPTILIRFSLPEFIIKRHLYILDIDCYKPQADYYEFANFLKNNLSGILDFICHLPRQDIKFEIKDARFYFAQNTDNPDFISTSFNLQIKEDSVSADGYIASKRNNFSSMPLKYNCKGTITKEGFAIKKLELLRENFYTQLWGNISENALNLNGFAFMNTLFKEPFYKEPAINILDRVRILLHRPKASQEAFKLPLANLYLLDVDCQANLAFPSIKIERLSFSLNNIPFNLKGDIVLDNPLSMDLAVSSYLTNLKETRTENLKRIDLAIKGILEDKEFNGDCLLNIDFVKKEKGAPPLEKSEINLKGFGVNFKQYPRVKTHIDEASLFCKTDTNDYRVLLKGLNASFYLKNSRLKFVKFNSLFYDGFLKGEAQLNITETPPRINSIIRVIGVSANNLDGILIHFSKVYGKLASLMYFSNYPDLGLKGSMSIQNGCLKNFEFFKWLADLFDLPPLKKVDFTKASSNFSVDKKGASLHQIYLESKDVRLNGYFNLGMNDLVSSKLSLGLTRKLLKESNKFTPLLKLLGEEFSYLDFNFQLSGILHKMNFLWLESDFKRKLKVSVPKFIERRIDNDIENIIESISAKSKRGGEK